MEKNYILRMKEIHTYRIVQLGCDKNAVDGEKTAALFEEYGLKKSSNADLVFINTCGFIESAREESINEILSETSTVREEVTAPLIIVGGCLTVNYLSELKEGIPEAGHFIRLHNKDEISGILESRGLRRKKKIIRAPQEKASYAFIKISDGCSNRCSYCSIPSIRGPYSQRPEADIINESIFLNKNKNCKELILVGQDTAGYGFGKRQGNLRKLIEKLLEHTSFPRLRFMYMHPAHTTREIIDLAASEKRICGYIDLPLQHISDKILSSMNRKTNRKKIEKLIDYIRSKGEIALRTSLITGLPGEGRAEYRELLDFVKETKFERLGVFTYSPEAGTPAFDMAKRPGTKTAERRAAEIMEIQREISYEANKKNVGKKVKVLIDGESPDPWYDYYGRTERDAPEVDGYVLLKNTKRKFKTGDLIEAPVTDCTEYDLVADIGGKQ
ncbi:MAG: 30S ribosomal protein S12 methylthiotransferase RimO [Fibrobacterota bacterium]